MIAELGYTTHAFDRMAERDISSASVEAVVRSGEIDNIDRRGVVRYRLESLVVVVDGADVVTVYHDSDMRQRGDWSPKKRQRRGRKKEAKPAYIPGRGKINLTLQASYLRQMEERH